MSVFGMSLRHQKLEQGFVLVGQWKVELGLLLGCTLLALWNQNQASDSFFFTLDSLIGIAPYFLVSIGLAAYAKATGADNLIARAFSGRESMMILFASLMGGLSDFSIVHLLGRIVPICMSHFPRRKKACGGWQLEDSHGCS